MAALVLFFCLSNPFRERRPNGLEATDCGQFHRCGRVFLVAVWFENPGP
jgi:hypothetical protein